MLDAEGWSLRADGSYAWAWANWRVISYANGTAHIDDGRVGYLVEARPMGLGVRHLEPGDAVVIPWQVVRALLQRQEWLAGELPI